MALRLITKKDEKVMVINDTWLYHSFVGPKNETDYRGGVFRDVLDGFRVELNQENKTVTIKPGMGMLYGRQFAIYEQVVIDLSVLVNTQYVILYFEINTYNITNETVKIKYAYAGANYPVLTNDNLYLKERGVATLPFFKIKFEAFSHQPFINAQWVAGEYIFGESESTLDIPSFATINGRSAKKVFITNENTAYKTRYAEGATYAAGLQSIPSNPTNKNAEVPILDTNRITDSLKLPGRNNSGLLLVANTETVRDSYPAVFHSGSNGQIVNEYYFLKYEWNTWRTKPRANGSINQDLYDIVGHFVEFDIGVGYWSHFLWSGSWIWRTPKKKICLYVPHGTREYITLSAASSELDELIGPYTLDPARILAKEPQNWNTPKHYRWILGLDFRNLGKNDLVKLWVSPGEITRRDDDTIFGTFKVTSLIMAK